MVGRVRIWVDRQSWILIKIPTREYTVIKNEHNQDQEPNFYLHYYSIKEGTPIFNKLIGKQKSNVV